MSTMSQLASLCPRHARRGAHARGGRPRSLSSYHTYAQIHHLQPLGFLSKAVKTTLDQFAVVCANCHATIYYREGCRPVNELIP